MSCPWHPILPSVQVLQAKMAVNAILHSLPTPDQVEWGASLGGGHAGFALVHGYAALAEAGPGRQNHVDRARAHLETAVDLLPFHGANPGLFAGFTGVAWTVDHLQRQGLLADAMDLNEEITKELLALVERDSGPWLPELIDGLAGIGLYALDRPDCEKSRQIVRRVLYLLESTAISERDGTAWFDNPHRLSTFQRSQYPEGAFNLGVAHGNPGIIGFLAEAWNCGFQGARPLLDTSVAWLLSCKSAGPDGSAFARAVARGEPTNPHGGRLSWCYGDLGIAATLLMTAAKAGHRPWKDEAIQLALACADRADPWKGVVDAGLCHGAAGNAHLFTRLYHGTGISKLKESALQFYTGVLGMRLDRPEAGGFLAYTPPMPDEPAREPWTALPGLLEGSAGIGLSLLAATTPVEPSWDRHLLSHVPPAHL